MTFTQLIVYGLAVWRISSLFVHEEGPYKIFRTTREWSGIRHDETGKPWMIPDNLAAQALSCVWCASLYVALFFTAFYIALPTIALTVATIFAFSAIAIVIETYTRKI